MARTPASRRGNLFAPECPSRQVLQHVTSRWGVLVLVALADGERLVCEAWVLKPGRTLVFTEAEVWAERGAERTLVMKASATMAVVPRERG